MDIEIFILHFLLSLIIFINIIIYLKKIHNYKEKCDFLIMSIDSILIFNFYLFILKLDIFSLLEKIKYYR